MSFSNEIDIIESVAEDDEDYLMDDIANGSF